MSKFAEFQAFIAVVEAKSFTNAAERLNSAKSALSRRVATLEKRLGVRLLDRTTRTMELTHAGRALYSQGKRILADVAEAEAAVQSNHGELLGTIKMSLPLSFGVRHMAKPIGTFNKRHAKVHFDLDISDRHIDLIEEGFDLAIRFGESAADSRLMARPLFSARTVACASPHYLSVFGRPATPHDLLDHQCLTDPNSMPPDGWQYKESNAGCVSVKVMSVLESTSADFLCNAASHGMGVALLPNFIVSQAVQSGHLVTILDDYEWPGLQAYAICPRNRHSSHRVRSFIDFLAERFSAQTPWDREAA